MNGHFPQSELTANELRQLAAVKRHMISPRLNAPIIVPVQDTLLGVNRLTSGRFTFKRRDMMNMMMHSYGRRTTVPKPANANGTYTGQQVIETILPPVTIRGKGFEIAAGRYTKGAIEKGASKKIVHQVINDFGDDTAVQQLDALQRVVAHFLVLTGFSVGVSDLVADTKTRAAVDEAIAGKKEEVMKLLSEVHLGLMENKTGRSNEEVFEERALGFLNKATELAGNRSLESLTKQNRMTNMVKAGSKGNNLNIAQMMACLGQINVDGKRVAYGYEGRTLPHFRKYDDGPEARGFTESSFIEGLRPTEFQFHAISGREGLIDTAVKSVTRETPVQIMENGQVKYVKIGEWIDSIIDKDTSSDMIEKYDASQANMELVRFTDERDVYIPTMDMSGRTSWGKMTAVTRHDPGTMLYSITTAGGRTVTVTASKSLLVWDKDSREFNEASVSSIKIGDYLPTTASLCAPSSIVTEINMEGLFPKDKFIHGTDFHKAAEMVEEIMTNRSQIPAGWWEAHNGREFTLPYPSKARFQRALVRSELNNIKNECIYPFHAARVSGRIPSKFQLSYDNGVFIGLFVSEGHASVSCGTVSITNLEPSIIEFVENYFMNLGFEFVTSRRTNKIGGTSCTVTGYSRMFAEFLGQFVGCGAKNKHLPDVTLSSPDAFVKGIISGYFSGDGHISRNSVEASTASRRLAEDMSIAINRFGIFAKVFTTNMRSNNLGTVNIAPAHRLSIRGQFAKRFQDNIEMLSKRKQSELIAMVASNYHRNFIEHEDVVLDRIIEIAEVDTAEHPKMYDVTVPETLNFGLANGLQVRDTSDTGQTQRQLIKTMEDLRICYDGSVRNAAGTVVQTSYGDDGLDPMKVESVPLPTASMTMADILRQQSYLPDEKMELYIEPAACKAAEADREIFEVIREQTEMVVQDRDTFVTDFANYTDETSLQVGVPVKRIVERAAAVFMTENTQTDATPRDVVECLQRCVANVRQPSTGRPSKALEILLRAQIHPAIALRQQRLSKAALEWVWREVERKFLASLIQPGEMVGIVSAQSMGEPATQLTLNTFHSSGTAKAAGTRGVPRLKEIIHLSQNLKNPSLTVYLDDDHRFDQDAADKVKNRTQRTIIRDIVAKTIIQFEPTEESVYADDRDLLRTQKEYEELVRPGETSRSPWVLRFTLDPREMLERGIGIEDVEFVLSKVLEGKAETIMGETLAQELVMRIRLSSEDFENERDAMDSLRDLEKRILKTGVLTGVNGISHVTMRKETKKRVERNPAGDWVDVEEWVLDTVGSNLLDAFMIRGANPARIVSNDIVETQNVLGIDAARNCLIAELIELLYGEGAYVNPHHITLLCDNMTQRGKLLSVDRFGVKKSEIGPLGRASFEETEMTLLHAASHGELDPVTGVSANVMFGQSINGGTTMSRVLVDEASVAELASASHVQEERERLMREAAEAREAGSKQSEDVIAACAPENIEIKNVATVAADRFAEFGEDEL